MSLANGLARKSATLCAMQVIEDEDGTPHMGLLTQLSRAGAFEVCGPGFNDRTVKVRVGGNFYFVFREDIERGKTTYTESSVA